MQLGGSHIDHRQKRPLEGRERQAKFDPLEDGGVEEEEGFPVVTLFSSFFSSPFSNFLHYQQSSIYFLLYH